MDLVQEVDAIRVVDMRSDTISLPSQAMKEVVLKAPLGDDVFGEDPTVMELQEKVASLLGKEAALFVASGTMGNLVSVLSHCWGRGSEIIVGDESHIYKYEQGGVSQLGGVSIRTVRNLADGTFSIEEMVSRKHVDDVHFPITSLVCIENTHGYGGKAVPLKWLDEVGKNCRELGLPLHVDGARLFNAAVALNVPPARLVQDATSVTISLSKGLGAPVGSVIAASATFIEKALRIRKVLGGGMRQVGVLASMGIFALENATKTLKWDHEQIKIIGKGLSTIESTTFKLHLEGTLSNMLVLELNHPVLSAVKFCERMTQCPETEYRTLKKRVLCKIFDISKNEVRFVSNCNMADGDAELIVQKIKYVIKEAESQCVNIQ